MLLSVLVALATVASAAPAPQETERPEDLLWHIREVNQARNYVAAKRDIDWNAGADGWKGPKNGQQLSYTVYWNDRYVYNFWKILDMNGGNTAISSGDKCIDAGLNPQNGTPLKVWDCYAGVPQQTWQVVDRKKIRLANTNLCWDMTDAATSKAPQLWQCYDNNRNQEWTFHKTVWPA